MKITISTVKNISANEPNIPMSVKIIALLEWIKPNSPLKYRT